MAVETLPAGVRAIQERGRRWRSFWRWTAAIALPIGPLSILVGRTMLPYWTDDPPAEIAAAVIENRGLMEFIGWLGLIAAPAMLLGALTLGYVARRGSPLLATLGAGLTFVAFANWSAAGNSDLLAQTMADAGYDVSDITRLGTALSESAIGSFTGMFWVVGHILGMVLLGVALGRAHVVNWWVAGALIISQPMHLVSAIILPSRWLDATAGWGFTTLAFVVVAVVVARMPDDEWDPWPAAVRG